MLDVQTALPSAITLQHVLAQGTLIEWPEAVAIVEELCAMLIRTRSQLVPEPSGVRLTSHGTLDVTVAPPSDAPVARLGALLQSLLSASPRVPGALRVVATSAGAAYASLADFGQALAFFGHSDRRPLIKAVFDRCLVTPSHVTGAMPVAPVTPAATSGARRSKAPSHVRIAGASSAVIVVAAGTLSLWIASPAGRVSRAGRQPVAKDAAREIGQGGIAQPRRRIRTPAAAGAHTSVTGDEARVAVGRKPESAAVGVPADAHSGTVEVPVATPPREWVAEVADVEPVVTTEVVTVPVHRTRIYSKQDVDVRAPVLADRPLAQPTFPELDSAVVNRIEVLVGEDGSVERVRMVSRPRRMADMMILSSVKMWKFRPASKDGRPVKYWTALNWTVTP